MQRRHLLRGRPFETAYFVIDGQSPGPTIMISAGTHGNEPAGIRAAQDLLKTKLAKGRLIVIPIVNLPAIKKHIRGAPDINRTFPRKAGSTASHPLSSAVLHIVMKERPSWIIDMHEAGGYSATNRSHLGQSILTSPRSKASATAKVLIAQINSSIKANKHHFTHKVRERPGSLRTAASQLGIRAMTIETSINLPMTMRTHYHAELARLLMRQIGLVSSRIG